MSGKTPNGDSVGCMSSKSTFTGLFLGLFTMVAGLVVLVGWLFDIAILKSVLPWYVTMKANTALCFVLVGLSLMLLSFAKPSLKAQRLTQMLAVAVALIGFLTICQYLFGMKLGIDQMLFRESANSAGTFMPGRMDPSSAINFILLSCAIFLVNYNKTITYAQGLVLLTGLNGILPLVGYLYGASAFIGIGNYTQMSVLTAVLLILTSIGVLSLHPKNGIMRTITGNTMGGWLMRHLLPFLVGVLIALGFLSVQGERYGYFESALGVSFMMVCMMLLLTGLVWWAAKALNRIDSARQQSETSLHESEERYRRLFESAKDGILLLDFDTGVIMDANQFLRDLLGYCQEELLGRYLWELGFFKDVELSKDAFQKLQTQDYIRYENLPLSTKDGKKVEVEFVSNVYRIGGKKVIQCNIRDISERVESELKRIKWMLSPELSSSEIEGHQFADEDQGYGDLTELNHGGIILQSISRDMLKDITSEYLNLMGTSSVIYEKNGDYAFGIFASQWCRMLDRASRKLCDTPHNAAAISSCRWLCHESGWSACAKEAIAKRAPVDIECNGGIRLYSIPIFADDEAVGAINFGYGNPPKDPVKLHQLADFYKVEYEKLFRMSNAYNSRPAYIIEMAKKRIFASARLIGTLIELKRAEQEQERMEAQLRQAQKMESIGQLAGGVAHDFNNILSVINGYSDMLLEKIVPSDPKHELIKEINIAGKRSADLVQQLLAFARKQPIAPKILDLNETISAMLKMLLRLIGENIELIWNPSDNLWKVKMDPTQVNQILANLLVNARDAISGTGKIVITTGRMDLDKAFCTMHPDSVPGKYVLLSVSDNGCGMDKETIEHIFEPFFTTKKAGEGTGLGLSTVFGIVKQNNGFINIYSKPGKGTTFKIYLPRDESENAGKDEKPQKTGIFKGTETVLVAEDEKAMLLFVRKQLEHMGYNVLPAESSAKAIKIAGEYKGHIHLLLTDVVMPEMNGIILKERIKLMHPEIKCLYMSGYTAEFMSNIAGLDEEIHFIEKPFTAKTLSKEIRAALA